MKKPEITKGSFSPLVVQPKEERWTQYDKSQTIQVLIQVWELHHFHGAGALRTPEVERYLDRLEKAGLLHNTGVMGSNLDPRKKEKYPLYRLTQEGLREGRYYHELKHKRSIDS